MNIYDTLASLNITLPPVATPAAAYVPFVQTGKLVFISGHIAKKDGKPWVGQLGKNMQTEEGAAAARGRTSRHATPRFFSRRPLTNTRQCASAPSRRAFAEPLQAKQNKPGSGSSPPPAGGGARYVDAGGGEDTSSVRGSAMPCAAQTRQNV